MRATSASCARFRGRAGAAESPWNRRSSSSSSSTRGLVVRAQAWFDRDEALEAVGLSE